MNVIKNKNDKVFKIHKLILVFQASFISFGAFEKNDGKILWT